MYIYLCICIYTDQDSGRTWSCAFCNMYVCMYTYSPFICIYVCQYRILYAYMYITLYFFFFSFQAFINVKHFELHLLCGL